VFTGAVLASLVADGTVKFSDPLHCRRRAVCKAFSVPHFDRQRRAPADGIGAFVAINQFNLDAALKMAEVLNELIGELTPR
jgi:hypothetical protein